MVPVAVVTFKIAIPVLDSWLGRRNHHEVTRAQQGQVGGVVRFGLTVGLVGSLAGCGDADQARVSEQRSQAAPEPPRATATAPAADAGCPANLSVKAKVAYRPASAKQPTLERVYDQCVSMQVETADGSQMMAMNLRAKGEANDANVTLYIPEPTTWGADEIKVNEGEVKGGKVDGEEADVVWEDNTPAVPEQLRGMYRGATGRFKVFEHAKGDAEFVGVGFEGTLGVSLGPVGMVADVVVGVRFRVAD